ncbi:DUF2147 domain-containing protein [Myroides sp. LJL116]
MRKILLVISLFLVSFLSAQAQEITGKWKTVDDATGKEKSIVEIYEKSGKYYGKIVQLLDPSRDNPLCEKCEGENKDKPILGLVFINNMQKKNNDLSGGTILDPETGKVYKCSIKLESANKLNVRGYVGISLLGRTQSWQRVE